MDILQNSLRAGASVIRVDIVEDTKDAALTLSITDNGRGMSPKVAEKAADPFFTTRSTRKVGLGLSLLKQNAERTGGLFSLESAEGKGTRIMARFITSHPDHLISGDIPGVIAMTSYTNPGLLLEYTHTLDGRSYQLPAAEIREALGGVMPGPEVYSFLKEMVSEKIKEIGVKLDS